MGWDQLRDIYREAAEEARNTASKAPEACPNDGEPLREGPGGVRYCPFDGWQYPRDWR